MEPHREASDGFWSMALNLATGIWLLFGLNYAKVEVIPVKSLPRRPRGLRRLDSLYLGLDDPRDSWAKAKRRMVKDSRDRPQRHRLVNIEHRVTQSPEADGDQLFEYWEVLVQNFGRHVPIDQFSFVTGDFRPSQEALMVYAGNRKGPNEATVVFLGDLDADQVPDIMRNCPFGSIVVLALPNGCKPHHVRHALTMSGQGRNLQRVLMLQLAMQFVPNLRIMVDDVLAKLKEETDMANGVAVTSRGLLKEQISFVEGLIQRAVDKTQLPSYRKLMRQNAREQRKLERKLEREHEREQRKLHADGLLSILAGRDMQLTKSHERQLHAMPLAKLPAFEVAVHAKSASDFARQAGLKNARK